MGDGTADLELYGEQQMNEIHLRRMATDEARTPPQTPPQRPLISLRNLLGRTNPLKPFQPTTSTTCDFQRQLRSFSPPTILHVFRLHFALYLAILLTPLRANLKIYNPRPSQHTTVCPINPITSLRASSQKWEL